MRVVTFKGSFDTRVCWQNSGSYCKFAILAYLKLISPTVFGPSSSGDTNGERTAFKRGQGGTPQA